jgi:hypothetical protein
MVARVAGSIDHAALPLAQSIVGWAGRPEVASSEPRMARLRENALAGAVAWLEKAS